MPIECYDKQCVYNDGKKPHCGLDECHFTHEKRIERMGHQRIEPSNNHCVFCGEDLRTKQGLLYCKGDLHE